MIRQFFNWWFLTLLDMVPDAVFNVWRRVEKKRMDYTLYKQDKHYLLLDRQGKVETKQVLERGNDLSVLTQLLRKIADNRRVCLLLAKEQVLLLTLTYPVEVMQNIERVLQHDLEKQVPLPLSEVDYVYVIDKISQAETISVQVAVVKKSERIILNTLANQLRGGRLFCTTPELYEKWGTRIDFLKVGAAEKEVSGAGNRFYLWLNVAILAAVFSVPLYHAQARFDNIADVTAAERQRAKQLLKQVHATREQAKEGEHLIQEMNNIPSATELLALLSRTIAPQAWIIRLDYDGHQLRLHGEADSASAVTDDLNRLDRFENIKFTSSIVKNSQTGKESFKLLMAIKK